MSFERPTAGVEAEPIRLDRESQEKVADLADEVAFKAAMDLMKLDEDFARGTLKETAFPEAAKALHSMIYEEICRGLAVSDDIRARIADRTRIIARVLETPNPPPDSKKET